MFVSLVYIIIMNYERNVILINIMGNINHVSVNGTGTDRLPFKNFMCTTVPIESLNYL